MTCHACHSNVAACVLSLQELCAEVPAAKSLFDRASEILGYDLLQVCVEGAALCPGIHQSGCQHGFSEDC